MKYTVYPCCFLFTTFVEIGDCMRLSPCPDYATCNDTEGSYTCTCDSGYSGDGFSCDGRLLHLSADIYCCI